MPRISANSALALDPPHAPKIARTGAYAARRNESSKASLGNIKVAKIRKLIAKGLFVIDNDKVIEGMIDGVNDT